MKYNHGEAFVFRDRGQGGEGIPVECIVSAYGRTCDTLKQ